MNGKERIIWLFVGIFYYLVLPASCLFSVVSGVIMSCYSFKATVFFLTGSASVSGAPMPSALLISVPELVIGLLFMGLGVILLWLYQLFSKRRQGDSMKIVPSSPQYIGDATPLDENTL